jgi:hypothetical protein
MAEPILFQGLTLDQATAMARYHANHGAKTVVTPDSSGLYSVQVTYADAPTSPATDSAGNITLEGLMSTFGGPNDTGVAPDEDLALFTKDDIPSFPGLFLDTQPSNTTGLARCLNPDAAYIACRWDYSATPKSYLKSIKVKVTNPATGKTADAQPVDWGPNAATGRVADLSPGLARSLALNTDFACKVVIPAPSQSPVSMGSAKPSDFAAKIEDIAIREWQFFGSQTYDLNSHVTYTGHKEGEDGYYQRIGEYWLEGTNTPGLDGRNHEMPWSAAFISWVMKTSGAGTRFRYSTLHSVYIYQAIRDLLQNRTSAGFWCWRLNEIKPKIGDIVCWSRQNGIDYDHQNNGNYSGHSDIVVEVLSDRVNVIGGNVGNSVTRRPLVLDSKGYLKAGVYGGETLIAVMENRIT